MWLLAAVIAPAGAFTPDYSYPLYPHTVDPSQVWMFKIMFDWGDGRPVKTVDTIMQYIKEVDNLTRGIPKIPILVGWQQGGHDWQYPAWYGPVNSKIKRAQDTSARQSLLWMASEAKKYHSFCTVHTNTYDANGSNAIEFNLFKSNDWICKNADGSYVTTSAYSSGYLNHIVNLAKEWEDGHVQKRLDTILAVLPFIKETKVLYCDNQTQWYNSPYNGYTADNQRDALKCLANYMMKKYSIDMIGESFEPPVYGFNSLWLNVYYNSDPMQLPAYVIAAGRGYGYDTQTNDLGAIFGGGAQLEADSYHSNRYNVLHDFAIYVLPYQFMNRCLRDSYNSSSRTLTMSDGVISYKSGSSYNISKDGNPIKLGDDVFIPAVWKSHREIIAYRGSGTTRTWTFPSDWSDVTSVDVYNLTTSGPVAVKNGVALSNHQLTIDNSYSITVSRGFSIVPAGTDINDEAPIPASGFVAFNGADSTTGGNWKSAYGTEGYYIVGDSARKPSYGNWSFKLGTEGAWAGSTTDGRALQKAGSTTDRIAARRSANLHEIIQIDAGSVPRSFAIYFLEWGAAGSFNDQMAVDVLDANSGRILHSYILNRINNGVYLKYTVTNKVQFRLTKFFFDNYGNPGGVPIFSGFFFGSGTAAGKQVLGSRSRYSSDEWNVSSVRGILKIGIQGKGAHTVAVYSLDGSLCRKVATGSQKISIRIPSGVYLVGVQKGGCTEKGSEGPMIQTRPVVVR